MPTSESTARSDTAENPSSIALAKGCWILHYDGHDLAAWKRKWLGRIETPRGHKSRRDIARRLKRLFEQGGETALEDYFVDQVSPTEHELEVALELDLVREIAEPVALPADCMPAPVPSSEGGAGG